jgi:hypothetical protein
VTALARLERDTEPREVIAAVEDGFRRDVGVAVVGWHPLPTAAVPVGQIHVYGDVNAYMAGKPGSRWTLISWSDDAYILEQIR